MPIEETATSNSFAVHTPTPTVPTASSAKKPRKPRTTAKNEGESFLYCLESGKSDGGDLQLATPTSEDEVLLAALKDGIPYYRLQKFTAKVVHLSDGLKIVGVPS